MVADLVQTGVSLQRCDANMGSDMDGQTVSQFPLDYLFGSHGLGEKDYCRKWIWIYRNPQAYQRYGQFKYLCFCSFSKVWNLCTFCRKGAVITFLFLFRAEAIHEKLSKSIYVSNAARRVLKLPLITEQDLHKCKNEVSPMQQNGASPRRRRHQNSGNSESSVEVLPDLETDEQKFENALLAAGPF